MTTKELIRQEIVRRIEWLNTATNDFAEGRRAELRSLYDFLDTLPDESEQPTRGYDEAYLNEKIAKASKSWKGVDVNKFMDEVRGREPVTDCDDLTEAAENSWAVYEYRESPKGLYSTCYVDGFKAGAELQRKQMPMPEDTILFQKGVEEGKRLMMEGAVEGEVEEVSFNNGEQHNTIRFSFNEESLHVENRIWFPRCGNDGDKVKLIIVKED